jgi:hypothetical protein
MIGMSARVHLKVLVTVIQIIARIKAHGFHFSKRLKD